MSKCYVLDANAVLDYVEDGPGGKRVEQLFKKALHRRARVLMSGRSVLSLVATAW